MPRDPEKQRAAKRRYYARNRQLYRDKADRKREGIKQMMRDLKSVPCKDCGRTYAYYVMDFDHREGKQYLVSKLVNSGSLRLFKQEVAKCDVVCANCHRERSYGQTIERQQRLAKLPKVSLPGSSIGRTSDSGSECLEVRVLPRQLGLLGEDSV